MRGNVRIICEHCGAKKKNHGAMCSACGRFGTPLLDIPRSKLREMGVPDDISDEGLIDFFMGR